MVATQAPVVARSPDLATRPTEGLPSRLQPGDLRSRSRRGLETRAEPSPARNRQVIPGPFLEYHYHLGYALHDRGNKVQAIAEYREAIGLKPDHAEAHSDLAPSPGI